MHCLCPRVVCRAAWCWHTLRSLGPHLPESPNLCTFVLRPLLTGWVSVGVQTQPQNPSQLATFISQLELALEAILSHSNFISFLSIFASRLFLQFTFSVCLVAQSRPTLCDPVHCRLPGSCVHGNSSVKDIGVGCHALLQGNLPHAEIEPRSPALQVDSLLSELPAPFGLYTYKQLSRLPGWLSS